LEHKKKPPGGGTKKRGNPKAVKKRNKTMGGEDGSCKDVPLKAVASRGEKRLALLKEK